MSSPPRFALTADYVHFVAPLDAVAGLVALNETARALVDEFCRIGCQVSGPGGQPTIEMLRVVLALLNYPHEERPLDYFGRLAPFGPFAFGGSSTNN